MARIMHDDKVEIWRRWDAAECSVELVKYLRENYPDEKYPRITFNMDSDGVHFYIHDGGNR